VLVFVFFSRIRFRESELDEDVIKPSIGCNERCVRVFISAEIDLAAFVDEIVDRKERYITTKGRWGAFCGSG
jgi:hypothetical protein